MPFAPVTLGETVQSRQVAGFIFTDTRHVPEQRLGGHAHAHAAISFPLCGGFRQEPEKSSSLVCLAGQVLVEPPARKHRTIYPAETTRTLIVEIPELPGILDGSRIFERYHLVQSPAIDDLMHQLAAEFCGRSDPNELILQVIAVELLVALSCDLVPSDKGSWLQSVVRLVREGYGSGLRLNEIAQRVDRHPMHLCKAFRQAYGYSIGDFIRSLQVRHAMELLQSSDATIGAIAAEAGFSDQSHFGRVFRSRLGMTPRAYKWLTRSRACKTKVMLRTF